MNTLMILALIFIGLSLFLYLVLGGADFGAGIIELFTGNRGATIISKAIAPIWEANHIWIIVVIVILFNAFPEVYSTIALNLHIPLMLTLLGIIFRGTSFAFRYSDPYNDRSHRIYSAIFRIFSILTPFFLGVTIGAVISGNITTEVTVGFYDRFVKPWLGIFPVSLGIFMILLFAYLAAVYLVGEPSDEEMNNRFKKYAKRLQVALVFLGAIVFMAAWIDNLPLLQMFMDSWISIVCVLSATILIPIFFLSLSRNWKNLIRVIAGAQTGAILIGWVAVQLPVMVSLKGGNSLTIFNTVASDKTLLMMIIALFVGLAVVIPLLVYLFRVFKFSVKG